MDLSHLTETTASLMRLSNQQRIEATQSRTWFPTLFTKQAFAAMQTLPTREGDRPAHLVICINYANGLTSLLQQFAALHNSTPAPSAVEHTPVIYIDGRLHISNQEIHYALLRALGMAGLADLYSSPEDVMQLLMNRRVRWILVEGIDLLLEQLDARHSPWWRSLLRRCRDAGLHMVVGAAPAACKHFFTHPELAAAFDKLRLPLWQDGEAFREVLREYEKALPLRYPSNLASDPLAGKLLSLCSGRLAVLGDILVQATVNAIRNGREQITLNQLHGLNYQTLSDSPQGTFE